MTGANTKGIIAMSVAVAILAKAVKALSEVENMGKGLLGVGALLGELTAFCIVFDKMKLKPKALQKTAAGLILMAIAINLLAKPVKELGSLDTGQLVKGLSALAVMLGEFTLTALAFSKIKTGGIGKAGAAMLIMAVAMKLLAKPLMQLGSMDLKSLAKGLGAMGAALLELAGFTAIMSLIASSTGNIMKTSAALLVMSVGIKIMAGAISQMGSDSGAGKGLAVMFGSLVILAGAMALMQKSLAGAAAMIVVAGALAIMAPAIALLSSLNIGGVATGLLALAGTLAIFGVGALVLGPVIPLMIALSAAMALLGVGVLGLGAGMTMLTAAFAMATGPIVDGATAIATAFPIVAKGIGDGIVATLAAIGDGATEIKNSFVKIIEALLGAVSESAPKIIATGIRLILLLLQGIKSSIGQIVSIGIDIIVNFINGISSGLPKLVDAAFNLMVSFCNALADGISANGDRLSVALMNVILAAIGAAVGLIPGFGKAAKKAIDEYRKGLQGGQAPTQAAAKSVANAASSNLTIKSQYSNGRNAVQGLINGLGSLVSSLKAKARTIADTVDSIIRKRNQVASPSKRLFKTGTYMMRGLIGGLDSLTGEYERKADNIATFIIGSASRTADEMSSAMNRSLTNGFDLTNALDRSANVDVSLRGIVDRNTELSNMMERLSGSLDGMVDTMNSRSLNNYINITGNEDPDAFADALTRRFRLNARTI